MKELYIIRHGETELNRLGIAAYVATKESGRAKQANGGGGGNSHNTGGGGGGNFGSGGRGGDKKNTGCPVAQSPFGYGAVGLGASYYNNTLNKIFMGGGGGGGQQNNSLSYNAGDGAGIIIIKAVTLNSNGFLIQSNGGSVASYYTTSSPGGSDNGDGNSGGGAGGTVLLDVTNYSTAASVEAMGGKGGDTGYLDFDFGPGGGGGGGVVWTSAASGGLLSSNVSGGTSGISGTGRSGPTPYGSGTSWGATNGTAGTALSALSIPQSSSTSSCALPVELLSFKAIAQGKYKVQLHWSTATELNNQFFTLERSTDGIHFSPISKIDGQRDSHQKTSYTYTDEVHAYSILYYKLSQTDIDGVTTDLGIRNVYPAAEDQLVFLAYPNPFKDELHLTLDNQTKESVKNLVLVNVYGETIPVTWKENENYLDLSTVSVPSGLYSLILSSSSQQQIIKVIKE